jgi:ubiquinone/menaquinone biosynthesis C-methylase UbiE
MSESLCPDFSTVAEGWAKWDELMERSYANFNDLFLTRAGITVGKKVLDLGCGSGFPSLLEADMVGSSGNVIGIDISKEMTTLASKRAQTRGLKNLEYRIADMESLSFADHTFNAITARFSLMFVSSIEKTLSECFRVLKTSGKLAASVWGDPEKNPLPRKIVGLYFTIPSPSVKMAGPFRFSEPGVLKQLLADAGFSDVTEEEVSVHEIFESGRQYAEHILEASALWGGYLRKLDPDRLAEAKQRLIHAAEEHRSENEVRIRRTALILSGTRRDAK